MTVIRSTAQMAALAARLPGIAALHDHLDRTAHPDEQDRQAFEALRAIGEYPAIVVPDIDDDDDIDEEDE